MYIVGNFAMCGGEKREREKRLKKFKAEPNHNRSEFYNETKSTGLLPGRKVLGRVDMDG